MKIQFLKNGGFSLDPVYGPVIQCIRNKVVDEFKGYEQLIEAGWARKVDDNDKVDQPEKEKEIVKPWKLASWREDAPNAKDMLESYGKVIGIDVDRRMKIKKIIAILEKAA